MTSGQEHVLGTAVGWVPGEKGAPAGKPQEEHDDNIVVIPDRVTGKTMIGRLRKGYHIQVGGDPNDPDSFVHGPAEVPLTPKTAIAHLAKFENVNDIKFWLARDHPKLVDGKPHLAPRTQKRETPQERLDRLNREAQDMNAVNNNRTVAGSPTREQVASFVRGEIQRYIEPVNAKLDALLDELRSKAPRKGGPRRRVKHRRGPSAPEPESQP